MNHIPVVTYAIRYCVTRHTYAFEDGITLAGRYWGELDDATKSDVLREVRARGVDRCGPIPAVILRALADERPDINERETP